MRRQRNAARALQRSPSIMRRIAVVVLLVLASREARAQPSNAVYVEALGRGGLWGVGYDHRFLDRLLGGIVAGGGSFADERYVSLSPYLGIHIARYGRSAWYADGGPQFAHVWADSTIPEWEGMSTSGVGAIFSTGYEFRSRVLFRLFVQAALGKGGVLPWAGADIGFTF